MVKQKGFQVDLQTAIIPRANFICNGKITSIEASMEKIDFNGTDPYIEIWHPTTPEGDVFDKVGGVQLMKSEVVEEVDNNNNTYWLVNITLNGDDRIAFEAGDVIGYYQPPSTRYKVSVTYSAGYRLFGYEPTAESNTIKLNSQRFSVNNLQPLIQFTIGTNDLF